MKRKRMDGVAEEVTKEVEVSKMVEPSYLTLTKLPANQVSFKVIRDDNGDTNMSQQAPAAEPTRRRRIRSTQRSSLLFIEFPEGATDDDVKVVAEEYGLDGYEVTLTSDGRKCLKRSDLTELPESAITVKTEDGKRLGVARSEPSTPAPTADSMPFIEVVAVEFDKTAFADEVATGEYLKRYDIDFLEDGVENTDKLIRVVRSELASGAEVRRVEVEKGVVAVVTRAATEDDSLPSSKFTVVVDEACYGNWGWGHLDFNAMMADVEFCRAVDEATWRLSDLMNRILFWSELPVAARKELVNRAAGQYSEYIGALLDGLPAKVILVNRSSMETKESKTMTQKTTDEVKEPTPAVAATETPAVADEKPITRSELTALIAEGVAAAMAVNAPATVDTTDAPVQRSDDGKTQGDEADSKVLASVDSIADSVKSLAASMEAMTKRMDSMEGVTVVRSDNTDAAAAPTQRKDVFAGVFGRRGQID